MDIHISYKVFILIVENVSIDTFIYKTANVVYIKVKLSIIP